MEYCLSNVNMSCAGSEIMSYNLSFQGGQELALILDC